MILGLSSPAYCSLLPEYLHCKTNSSIRKQQFIRALIKSNGKLDNASLQNNVTFKYIPVLLGTAIRMTITVNLSHLHHKRIQIQVSRGQEPITWQGPNTWKVQLPHIPIVSEITSYLRRILVKYVNRTFCDYGYSAKEVQIILRKDWSSIALQKPYRYITASRPITILVN